MSSTQLTGEKNEMENGTLMAPNDKFKESKYAPLAKDLLVAAAVIAVVLAVAMFIVPST